MTKRRATSLPEPRRATHARVWAWLRLQIFQSGAASYLDAPSEAAPALFKSLRLPSHPSQPRFILHSDPAADLCAHLRRHAMLSEAQDFEEAEGITADFVLEAWIQSTSGGAKELLRQTHTLFSQHLSNIDLQIGSCLPRSFHLPVGDGYDETTSPTHIVAIQGKSDPRAAKTMLLPCHALMYVLQCGSLPKFPSSDSPTDQPSMRTLPVVLISVSRPADFLLLHQFLYTRDTDALFAELSPSQPIKCPEQIDKADRQAGQRKIASTCSCAKCAISIQTLLGYIHRIQACSINGSEIGLLNAGYWSTLSRAWTSVTTALQLTRVETPESFSPSIE